MKATPSGEGDKILLQIQLLGGFSVTVGDVTIPEEQWKSRRTRNLVKLLALAPAYRLHRDQVIDNLWPDSDFAAATNNFHQALYGARQVFKPYGTGTLQLEEGFLSLCAGTEQAVSVDADRFEEASTQAKDSQDPAVYQAALDLYRGDLLPDDLYEEWTVQRRDALRQLHLKLLLDLANIYEERGEYAQSLELLQRLLVADRIHEGAHAGLMRLHAKTGQRQQALRQYQALKEMLHAELDAEPSESTSRLYEQIKMGQFPAVEPPGSTQAENILPPPKTQEHNLPAQLTSFVGREREIKNVCKRVQAQRLVTLTGPGGTGKTRLALQAAANLLHSFPDGIWLVELAPLADPALITQAVANVLGLRETPGRAIYQKVIEHLNTRHVLLIFDNCEHLVEAAAALCEQLLQACPHLHILATSREILGSMGETIYRVPSLNLPGEQDTSPDALARCEAVRLFIERASAAQPAFHLSEGNAPMLARICKRLDGIPLAIELAAARVRLLSVEQIAARLDDSFRLLTGASRAVLPRHQTLRALIDWSYNLLTPEEQALFMRLSVFAGSFTLDAVEYVCSDPWAGLDPAGDLEGYVESDIPAAARAILDPDSILDLLAQLVDKSLVVLFEGPTGEMSLENAAEPRYRMLETIRQYARDRLFDSSSGAPVRDRHLAYFLLLAEEAEPYLRRGSQVVWLDRLDAELDNIRLALEWSSHRRVEEGLRLSAALLWFWHIRGHALEGVKWLRQLFSAEQKQAGEQDAYGPDSAANHQLIHARALITTGFLSQWEITTEQTRLLFEQAVAILREIGPAGRRWLGVALLFLAKPLNDYSQRMKLMEEALPLLREAGDLLYLAEYSRDLGSIFFDQNQLEQATAAVLETLSLSEKIQDLDGIGTAALTLGDLALARHDFHESQRMYEKSLACYRVVKNRLMETNLLSRLGNNAMLAGNMTQAAARFTAGLEINQRAGDRLRILYNLIYLGRLELNLMESMRASQRFAQITNLAAEIGATEIELTGLLYQGLAAIVASQTEKLDELIHSAIDCWRRIDKEAFNQNTISGYLEYLAVLLSKSRPGLAARLFSAIDRDGLAPHPFNTSFEIALLQEARAAARHALGEEGFSAAQAEGMRLTPDEALQQVFNDVGITEADASDMPKPI